MKKISTLFVINYTKNKGKGTITEEIRPENSWVFEDLENVVATQKFDGTAALILNGELYKRYDAKADKQAPEGAIPCQEPDSITGHHPHWVKVTNTKENKYFLECDLTGLEDGTYEMCGEKVGTNPEKIKGHKLIKHGSVILNIVELSFTNLKHYLSNPENDIEGIVFHHKDGRMCKLRKGDFNVKR